jgi:hypothetical protein
MKPGDICYLGGGGRPLVIRRIEKKPFKGWLITVSYAANQTDEDSAELHQLRRFDAHQLFTALPGDPARENVWDKLLEAV